MHIEVPKAKSYPCNAFYFLYLQLKPKTSSDTPSANDSGKLSAFQPYHQILWEVDDVEDRSNTHKGCNALYVEDRRY